MAFEKPIPGLRVTYSAATDTALNFAELSIIDFRGRFAR